MARIVVAVTIPDDNEYIVDFGTEEQSESFLEYATGWFLSDDVTYEVVSWDGPNDPQECGRCGCVPHGDLDCAFCEHVLCHQEVA